MASLTARLSNRGLDVVANTIESFALLHLTSLDGAKLELATMQRLIDEAKNVIALIETGGITRKQAQQLCGDLGEEPPETIRSIQL